MPQQPTRRKKSAASTHPTSLKGESLSPPPSDKDALSRERKPSPKKRSTMNSRDAAYDYSSLFVGTAPGTDEDSKMEDGVSPPASRSGDSRSRRRGKRLADDDDEDGPSSSRSSKRRRESNETEDQPDEPPVSQSRSKSRKGGTSTRRVKDMDSDIVDSNGKDDSSSENVHQGSATPLLDPPPAATNRNNGSKRLNGSKRSRSGKPDRVVDSEEPPTPTFRRADEPIRPARARVPQARSGLNEMRKRVGAILEYVGRLQAEVTPTETATPAPSMSLLLNSLILVDDVTETIEKPDLDSAPSMIIMQYLTKRCLDFEVKFGKYPGRYG